jgi:hypothetical protein
MLDGTLFIHFNGNCYPLKEVQKNEVCKEKKLRSKKTEKRVTPIKSKPAADHPWRQYSIKKSPQTTLM